MHAFFHTTNNNFKPGIVSYPNYWKTLPRMSQWIHNVAKITRFFATFLAALLVKSCTLLSSSSTKQRVVSPLWLSQGEISLLNEQASKKLTRLVTATKILNWVLWNAPCCAILYPLVRTTTALLRGIHEKKKPRILKRTPSGSFFFKRPTCSSSDMRNCTHKVLCVVSFSFSVKAVAQWFGGSLLFSLAMFSTVEGSVRLVIAVTKFRLLQKM